MPSSGSSEDALPPAAAVKTHYMVDELIQMAKQL
jgi:hypothetical protein